MDSCKFDLDNIQGDIWPGLSKRYQEFFFFSIDNPTAFKPVLKTLANEVITSSKGALKNRAAIYKVKAPKSSGLDIAGLVNLAGDILKDIHDLLPEHGHDIPRAKGSNDASIVGVNMSFTVRGMQKLDKRKFSKDPSNDERYDDPFLKGMFADMVGEGRDEANDWNPEFQDGSVDGVVLVCGTKCEVQAKTKELAEKYFCPSHGVRHLLTLNGNERPGKQRGHEHFGFLDGVSQPLIIGLDDETAKKPGAIKQLTRPGIILFGHDGEMGDEEKSRHPAWAKDGSLLVVRKIKQFVPEWDSFVVKKAEELGFTPGQFGARLVGRWQSGAPVQRNPIHDKPEEATWNEFDYLRNDHTNCPFASHMRKAKPRIDNDNRDNNDIMRRSIPYGPELRDDERDEGKTKLDRGLMFLCYQTSLQNGFQFIRNRWINADNFPLNKRKFTGGKNPGQDPVVGQLVKHPIEDDDKVLQMALVDGHEQHKQISFTPFIESNGGDYFFTPSLKLLRELAVAPA
ncbi:uncharacterized protein N7484_004078 [Penicillium longicatenatum]|uniref:uncharacterized protein n=1 Tax=Penicillium longicatenatum TaxID=1561947 RepID=UPI0025466C68|nr:uncharacterized protein N7484_004078 [Penicillium longicatenatum]KAJ5650355.1 hypothetical protein N7484_004078 [Penicillium longicatenatum]